MTTEKKRWGDRRDAVWLRDLDALHVFMPYLYPNRADNEAFISEAIDLENIDRYLAEKNAALPDGEEPYKLFYLLLAALAFRAAAAKVLPPEIANRRKLGFAVPIRQWLLQEEYNADVRRLFASAAAQRFFHREKLEALFCGFCSGRQQDWRKIWTIYTFLVWYELYFCGAQAPALPPRAACPAGGTASGDGGYRCAAR